MFDGYPCGPRTKDVVNRKWLVTYGGATVQVLGSMVFKEKREDFHSNKENKHRFITLLQDHLERQGCLTEQDIADADLLIVKTVIAASEDVSKPTVLVGEDSNLLVLLCFHTKVHLQTYTFDQSQSMGQNIHPSAGTLLRTKQ